jgi:hypothetical protein
VRARTVSTWSSGLLLCALHLLWLSVLHLGFMYVNATCVSATASPQCYFCEFWARLLLLLLLLLLLGSPLLDPTPVQAEMKMGTMLKAKRQHELNIKKVLTHKRPLLSCCAVYRCACTILLNTRGAISEPQT